MGENSYPGGKGQVFRWLINEIPPHRRFISLFLGHCAIMRNKRPAAVNVGLDLDADVVEHWRNRQPSAGVIVGADAPAVRARRWWPPSAGMAVLDRRSCR
jgi:hypothetical protein